MKVSNFLNSCPNWDNYVNRDNSVPISQLVSRLSQKYNKDALSQSNIELKMFYSPIINMFLIWMKSKICRSGLWPYKRIILRESSQFRIIPLVLNSQQFWGAAIRFNSIIILMNKLNQRALDFGTPVLINYK